MSHLFGTMNRTGLNILRFKSHPVISRFICVAVSRSFRTEKLLLLPSTSFNRFKKEFKHTKFRQKQNLNANVDTNNTKGVQKAENYLSDKLAGNNKNLTNEDWDAVRDDLIDNAVTNVLVENIPDFKKGDSKTAPIPRTKLVTRVNCDATIFGVARSLANVRAAISYYNYLTSSSLKDGHHMHHLTSLFKVINDNVCQIEEHEDFIINICEPVLKKGFGQVLPQVYWQSLQALASTRKWGSALDLADSIPQDQLDPIPMTKVYAALALKVYSEGNYQQMWTIMENPKFHNDMIELRGNIQSIIADRHNKVFLNWINHCEELRRTSGEQKADLELEKLFEYLGKVGLFMDEQVLEKIHKYYSTSTQLEVSINQIHRRTGECFNCGGVIPDNSMEPAEFELLKDAVLKDVLTGGDLFQSTNPQELKSFMRMLQNKEKFDVVMDGQNVAISGSLEKTAFHKQVKLQSKRLLDAVRHFHDMGKSILIIHRTIMSNYADYREISSLAKCILLDKVTQDDPYMIIAALHSGNDCYLLTNDLLRQHNFKLSRKSLKLGKLFANWQLLHQMRIPWIIKHGKKVGLESNKFLFTVPVRHKVSACKSSDSWHIPVREEKTPDKLSFMAPSEWVCIGSRDRVKQTTEEIEKMKSIAKSKAGLWQARQEEKVQKAANIENQQDGDIDKYDGLLKTLDKFNKRKKFK